MEIIYKDFNKNEFLIRWNEYLKNNITSYKYLPIYLDYMLGYTNKLLCDKSFVLVENNICVGICFLPVENINNKNWISLAEGYTLYPLCNEKRIERKLFKIIDEVSTELNVMKIKMYLDPLIVEYKQKFNSLLEYNFIDTSSSDSLINLKKEDKTIWQNLRKSYKSLINSILKNTEYEVEIIDTNNKSFKIHEEYRLLHEKCAGRVTRAKATFDKQYELLENDFASLIGLKFRGVFIGFNYFFHFQNTVVYASGADDPEYGESNIPIYHTILWKATIYYKRRGFEFIEYSQPCGFNSVNGFDDYLTEKQINISYFKRGMGTDMVPLFRGIKYYNKNILLEDIELFKQKTLENIEG